MFIMFIRNFLLYWCDESTLEFCPVVLDISCVYDDYEDYYNDDDFQVFADETENISSVSFTAAGNAICKSLLS